MDRDGTGWATIGAVHLIGTWKNKVSFQASVDLARELGRWFADRRTSLNISLLPTTTALEPVSRELGTEVAIGCQNINWDASHALTGETSAQSAKEAGATFAMIGHSERRTYLGETNEQVAAKLRSALGAGLGALVCIGETYAERVEQLSKQIITDQVNSILPVLREMGTDGVRVAYEPAWAITTSEQSLPANPELAAGDHAFIRGLLSEGLGQVGESLPLIYGAGVNLDNVVDFAQIADVDGVLVGGASQSLRNFTSLIDALEALS